MKKINHRKKYLISDIEILRNRVAAAYKICTGDEFLREQYRDGHSYETLASKLDESECGTISQSSLKNFFSNGSSHTTTELPFAESTIRILNCFANKFLEATSQAVTKSQNDHNALTEIIKHLQQLYKEDDILIGVEKANQAFLKYGAHPKILRHAFRFNMRVKDWHKINSIVEELQKKNQSEEIITLCNLALFECEVREAYSNFRFDKNEQNKKIRYAKKYLDKIPDSQHDNKEYWYWLGRWYLELWYSTEGSDDTDLKLSLSYFEKSLLLKYSWFVHCYKCMTLKLLDRKDFKAELKKYTDVIIEEKIKQPKRPSVRTYRISAFALNDDMPGLKSFLEEHLSPSSATDFQSTIFHHIEMIFFRDKKKQDIYKTVLKDWDNNLPVK